MAFKAQAQHHVRLLSDTKLLASLDLGGRKNKLSMIMAPRGQTNYVKCHLWDFSFYKIIEGEWSRLIRKQFITTVFEE